MKRRTEKFIERQNGNSKVMGMLTRKNIIIAVSIILVASILAFGYLWYARNYGQAVNIDLTARNSIDYEWQSEASDAGLVADYLFDRTKELMFPEDDVLIVSSYTLEGSLLSQPAANSKVFLLSDQALLLKAYVRCGDRIKAETLKNEIVSRFNTNEQGLMPSSISDSDDIGTYDIASNLDWLEAYMEFYSVYGTTTDYSRIKNLAGSLFDDNGSLIPENLRTQSFHEDLVAGVESSDTDVTYGDSQNSLNQNDSTTEETEYTEYEGVKISSIRLSLIRNLENNGFIKSGAYDSALSIVENAVVSDDCPLYAYAYVPENAGTEAAYVYESGDTAIIDVAQSIRTMRNLAEVQQLPNAAFSWLKSVIVNDGSILSQYSFISGSLQGDEAFSAYVDVFEIARAKEDITLFSKTSEIVGRSVATYSKSPALSMVFRVENERNVCIASDNLGIYLAII